MSIFEVFNGLYIVNICALGLFGAFTLIFGLIRLAASPSLNGSPKEMPQAAASVQAWRWMEGTINRLLSNVAFQVCFLTLLVVLYVLIPIGVIFFASIPPLNKYLAVVLSLLVARIISDMWRTGREGELYTGSHFIWRYLPPAISTVIVIFAFVNNIMSLIPLGGTPPGSPFFTQVNRDLLNFVLITYLAVRRLIDDIIKRLEKNHPKS